MIATLYGSSFARVFNACELPVLFVKLTFFTFSFQKSLKWVCQKMTCIDHVTEYL